jgi:hypothetical protein
VAPREPGPSRARFPTRRFGRSSSDWDVEFLIRFTRAGHEAGYPTADLEDRVVALARALELEGAQVPATPTLLEISLGSLPQQRTSPYGCALPPST